jgi:molecular chaperone GrpE
MSHETAAGSEQETRNQSPTGSSSSSAVDADSTPVETTDSPQTVVDSEDSELGRLAQELADMKDRYLRTVAEMDNMRKRLEREKADFIKFSNESILKDMIPVLDSLDKAVPGEQGLDPAVKSYREGVLMVQKQFLQTLAKHGLEPVEARDKPFDPNFHQAIQRIESGDVTTETVAAEFAKGYVLNGRLLRPSMVSVKVPG